LTLVGYLVLQALDIASTVYIVRNGGTELNPLMALLIRFDIFYFAMFKATLALFAACWFSTRYDRDPKDRWILWLVLGGTVGLYGHIVYSNFRGIVLYLSQP
jgi:hypothetical protein